LYLSSGLPVIVWKDSAEANFVEKNGAELVLVGQIKPVEYLQKTANGIEVW